MDAVPPLRVVGDMRGQVMNSKETGRMKSFVNREHATFIAVYCFDKHLVHFRPSIKHSSECSCRLVDYG
jgi:hypothetical protein